MLFDFIFFLSISNLLFALSFQPAKFHFSFSLLQRARLWGCTELPRLQVLLWGVQQCQGACSGLHAG